MNVKEILGEKKDDCERKKSTILNFKTSFFERVF